MMGKTHAAGGAVFALGGYILLKENSYLVADIAPALQLAIIYPFAMWASKAPDLDHHKDSIPMRDPISIAVNKGLHIFNKPAKQFEDNNGIFKKKSLTGKLLNTLACKHRAWQTHSEVTAMLLGYTFYKVMQMPVNTQNTLILLIMTGLILGFISHIVLDMMTKAGIPTVIGRILSSFTPLNIRNIRIVPNSSIFATDTYYEKVVRWLLTTLSTFLLIYIIFDMFGINIITEITVILQQVI